MTQEEILEYNKRCALFLGYTYYPFVKEGKYPSGLPGWQLPKANFKLPETYLGRTHRDLKFHSDWNWIMEVVEAIEKLGYQFDITGNEVGVNSNIMSMENISTGGTMNSYNRSYYPTIISVCEEEYSKKGAVVQAINQFLIWYNENR